MAEGDTVRTIVKFLSHEQSKEREEAISLLFELSKSEKLCEKIGSVNGAILILVGMASSKSENVLTVEKADQTLENLAVCETNVRQMAECGRLQPLLTLLLEGSPETKLSMASFLGELALNNDVKVFVARTAGSSLINLVKSNNPQSREAALKALNQISSDESSAKILIEAGILPQLVRDLFTVGNKHHFSTRLKEVSATILSNIVNSGHSFDSIPVGPGRQTLFIEAQQSDLQLASIKLLQNLSTHMPQELADSLPCQLGALVRVIAEGSGITEEQAAAVGLLAGLPEQDLGLTQLLLAEGTFQLFISRIVRIRQGETRGSRFLTPYLDGLVKVLSRVTFALSEESGKARGLCQEHNLAALFIDLLQANGLDNVQMVSAVALENLSHESKNLTKLPELPAPGFCASIFPCLSKSSVMTGLCKVHRGTCSLKETFCLLEGQAVSKLVALLDHTNDGVVEASLAALSTLLDDGVDIDAGIMVLLDADGVKPMLDLLLEKRTDSLKRRAVWVAERLLRNEEIAIEVTDNPNISTALVDAFQHGDYRTRQIAERALKHVDKIPNFSGVFPNHG
ncbi:ARM repeat superfamily protein [Striga asiatica]|uniref:ARM repeat superfamily protein n=1 Tax=Striga asiatica TaxID=4170 RepID=A0A5A7PX05_STRAF|nr:ARM repeat superfamily protein [Striga asiatica]